MKRRCAGKVSPNRGGPLRICAPISIRVAFDRSPGYFAWVVHAHQPVVLGATSQARGFATAMSARGRHHIAGKGKLHAPVRKGEWLAFNLVPL